MTGDAKNNGQNILFVAAMSFEGACVRRYLELQQRDSVLSEYAAPPYHLIVSGTGKTRAAAATGALCSRFVPEEIGAVVNVGIAGGVSEATPLDSTWLVNQICDASTKRDYYPDMLADHHFSESKVTTFDKPVSAPEIAPSDGLVDMEASAFFEAASLFVGPEKIICFKMVSDILLASPRIDTAHMGRVIEHALPQVMDYVNRVCECNNQSPLIPLTEGHRRYMTTIIEVLQLTRTQQSQLLQSVIRFIQKNPNAGLPEFVPARASTARERNQHFAQFKKELLC